MAFESADELPPMESFLPSDVARLLEDTGDIDIPRCRSAASSSSPRFLLQATARPFVPAFLQQQRRGFGASSQSTSPPQPNGSTFTSSPTTAEVMVGLPDRHPTAIRVSIEEARTQLHVDLMRFMTPSGPRRQGEGTQAEVQEIQKALILSERTILIQMTLLVAGFIIGPNGESVRAIVTKSGSDIHSCTKLVDGKECRVFFLEGSLPCMFHAIDIILEAVGRYKDLAEGKFMGLQVDKKQTIQGIDFYYQPPPRSAVPFAASLRTERSERNRRAIRT